MAISLWDGWHNWSMFTGWNDICNYSDRSGQGEVYHNNTIYFRKEHDKFTRDIKIILLLVIIIIWSILKTSKSIIEPKRNKSWKGGR
jgi:hypothetical protein